LVAERARLLAALKERPAEAALLRALGQVSARLGETAEAVRCYRRAMEAQPQEAEAHFELALLYLRKGNYRAGFIEYEWRLRRENCIAPRYAQGAVWRGQALDGARLMLHAEQGLGDAMQFIRFLPEVSRRVGSIYLACHPPLVRLFAGLEGLAGIVTEGDAVPACEYHCPLLSLPRLFEVTLESLPRAVPYLPLAGARRERSARRRVGLVWRAHRGSGNTASRSVPLAELRPLAGLPVEWVSLQREVDAAERAILEADFRAEILGDSFGDLRDTADVVEGLDLVLTVDTSVAHLAGALARPVWVLLPQWGDWRWLEDRTDSPWYPTATLFRQASEGDWRGPVQAMRAALERLAAP